jgi:recombination protein RecT
MSENLKEKFLEKVKQYGCKNEDLAINYFTRLDNELPKQKTPKTWLQIGFDDFVTKAIAYANIGIDPLAPKMLSFTLFANKTTGLSDVCFVEDVRCMELIARKFGVNCPENLTVELVYSTDKFSLVKKDLNNPIDGYLLQISNPVDRGVICGGVSLSEYKNPAYNKARFMSLSDIHKRTSKDSDFYKKWPEEMCEKTIAKNAWSKVVLDTTQLSEYYAVVNTENKDFEPENMEDLPFNPEHEV